MKQQLFHCFSCAEAGDIVQLVMLIRHVGTMEAVRWLVAEFAPDLQPDVDGILDDMTEEEKSKYRRGFLYGKIFEAGHEHLFRNNGKLALDYLVNERRYDPKLLKETEFMTWNPAAQWKKWLRGQFPSLKEEIDRLPLSGGKSDECKVALPYRDANGVILGFAIRHHTAGGLQMPNGTFQRWTSTAELKKDALYGLHRIRNAETVIIVEGYADAEYLRALGMKNIVALGTVAFSNKYMQGLLEKGVRRIVLSLDRDIISQAGQINTLATATNLAGSPVRVFVIDPNKLAPHKDPDELVKAQGLPAFQALVDSAESAAKWLPKHILGPLNPNNDLEWEEGVAKVLRYGASLSDPGDAVAVVDTLRTSYGMSEFALNERLEVVRQEAQETAISEELTHLADQAKQMSTSGRTEKALLLLEREGTQLLTELYRGSKEVQEPLTQFLAEKQVRDAKRKPGEVLGYALNEFPAIASAMSGIQNGLILIGADPNTGKTMLLVNLAVDLLNSNPRARILFYTLDDTRETIVNRFLAKLSQIEINDVQTMLEGAAQATLSNAYSWMTQMSTERLDIVQLTEGLTMTSIQDRVRRHPHKENLVLLIDGIYNIPLVRSYTNIREENIGRANGLKSTTKIFNIPLIGTAELRKRTQEEANRRQRTLHDLMESAKYAYNADAILLLTPADEMESFRVQEEPYVNLTFEKNKLSGYRDTLRLKFRKAIATFEQEGGAYALADVAAQGGPQ